MRMSYGIEGGIALLKPVYCFGWIVCSVMMIFYSYEPLNNRVSGGEVINVLNLQILIFMNNSLEKLIKYILKFPSSSVT